MQTLSVWWVISFISRIVEGYLKAIQRPTHRTSVLIQNGAVLRPVHLVS